MDIKDMAFMAGLILGCLIIISVCWVWIRSQVLGLGGGMLSFFGVLLVGLSVWSSASVQVSPEGFYAEFERLEREVSKISLRSQQISDDVRVVAEANQVIGHEVKVMSENIDINKAQFLQLTDTLTQRQPLNSEQINTLVAPLKTAPQINTNLLDSAIINLRKINQ
jgi:uncharacterized protein (UPF0335 family)